jgi:hypothetical protein
MRIKADLYGETIIVQPPVSVKGQSNCLPRQDFAVDKFMPVVLLMSEFILEPQSN